uniref:Chromo domain-containing protein n=1 Tax=Clytia hemisphaerica TaxID=252671 RepID=A0A7M5WXK7_9CNID
MEKKSCRKARFSYKFLHESSTATDHEIIHELRRKRSKKDVYQAEEVLAEKKIGKRTHYLVKWHGWGSETSTWEPVENILDQRLLDLWEKPMPDIRQVSFHVERLLSCIEAALKNRLKSERQIDFPIAIYRFLFNGRGEDKPRGVKVLQKKDFDRRWFPKDWYVSLINERGTKRV